MEFQKLTARHAFSVFTLFANISFWPKCPAVQQTEAHSSVWKGQVENVVLIIQGLQLRRQLPRPLPSWGLHLCLCSPPPSRVFYSSASWWYAIQAWCAAHLNVPYEAGQDEDRFLRSWPWLMVCVSALLPLQNESTASVRRRFLFQGVSLTMLVSLSSLCQNIRRMWRQSAHFTNTLGVVSATTISLGSVRPGFELFCAISCITKAGYTGQTDRQN